MAKIIKDTGLIDFFAYFSPYILYKKGRPEIYEKI